MVKYEINGSMSISKELIKDKTIVSICSGDEIKATLELGSQDYYSFAIRSNDNYIVIYSKSGVISNASSSIKAVYDRNNNNIVDISNDNVRSIFENMFITRKTFFQGVVIAYINMDYLGIADSVSVTDFEKYITCCNDEISRDEVVSYILKLYPSLEKFIGITQSSEMEYKNMVKEIGSNMLSFNALPQVVNSDLVRKNSGDYQYSKKGQ